MVISYDVGSLPIRLEDSIYQEGAKKAQSLLSLISDSDTAKIFESEIITGFIDKIKAGIDIPNYPQFRDMNDMYFELIRGIERRSNGYVAFSKPSAKSNAIVPEINMIKKNTSKIRDLTSIDKVRLKVCITGPYTLASFFPLRNNSLFKDLGLALSNILSQSIFNNKYGMVSLVCIDEPVLGFLNDPLLDYGSESRETLIKSWNEICRIAVSKGAETSMHLHDTSDDIFWNVEYLQLLESHVGDPMYSLDSIKGRLDETGKRLKASIMITLFDTLIEKNLRAHKGTEGIQQKIGDTWNGIRNKKINPEVFIENVDLMAKRLGTVVQKMGPENVPYAGPECGMGGWPDYIYAIEGLRRISEAVKQYSNV